MSVCQQPRAIGRAMMPSAWTTLALGGVLLSAIGCGGSSGSLAGSASGTAALATDASGQVVRSASGAAISRDAEKRFKRAFKRFKKVEESAEGWNEGLCSDVSEAFSDANDEQGGKLAEAIYMAGLSLDRCGERADALKWYRKAVEVDAKMCRAHVGIGLDHVANGRDDQAMAAFKRAVSGRCAEGYVNLGILEMAQDGAQSKDAENNLRRALAFDSNFLPAFNQMALLFLERAEKEKKKLDLAQVVCQQAVKIDADYAPIYNTWGLIKLRNEELFDALRMFERAFQLDPTMFEAHMNFGHITLNFRGYQDAKRAFEAAVKLRSDSFDAHLGLGSALRGLEDTDGAKREFEAAKSLKPKRPEAYFNLGVLHQDYMTGDVKDLKAAKKLFGQFLERAKDRSRYGKRVTASVSDVERRCKDRKGKRRKRGRNACRPGRLQNIELAIDALSQMKEMEAMQKQMEAEQKQMEAQEAAQRAAEEAAAAAAGTAEKPTGGEAKPAEDGAAPE